MKLYAALRDYSYEGFVIIGIYSARNLAEAACENDRYPADDPTMPNSVRGDGHSVEEFTLDVKSE